jgi:zeaxanthin epoxidase
MQPNLGQGGCMAIEDSYELAKLIDEAMPAAQARADAQKENIAFQLNIPSLLKKYQGERMMRASAIHGMARMAAVAASTYKAYLGEQFHLEDKIKILHPGRVMGQFVLGVSMPLVLGWVLGGNTRKLKVTDRVQYCTLDDQPHGFGQNDWDRLMKDDEALLRASHALWVLAALPGAQQVMPHHSCLLQYQILLCFCWSCCVS